MEDIIKNQIPYMIDLSMLIFLLITISAFIIILKSNLNAYISMALFTIIVLFYVCYIPRFCEKKVTYINENMTYDISFQNNQIINSNTDTFKTDNQKIKVFITNDTMYFRDSTNKPYIIVNKVNFHTPYNIFLTRKCMKNINNKTIYILDEVHY